MVHNQCKLFFFFFPTARFVGAKTDRGGKHRAGDGGTLDFKRVIEQFFRISNFPFSFPIEQVEFRSI